MVGLTNITDIKTPSERRIMRCLEGVSVYYLLFHFLSPIKTGKNIDVIHIWYFYLILIENPSYLSKT